MKHFFRHILERWLHGCVHIALARHHPLVVAIAGSTDKTTVKAALSERLSNHHHRVRAHAKSYNTSIGLPLAILDLPSGQSSSRQWLGVIFHALKKALFERTFPDILVVELGVDHPGEMRVLLGLIQPTIVVVTSVTGQYVAHFGDLEAIAVEFAAVVNKTHPNGLVILNDEDLRVRALSAQSRAPVVLVGHASTADAQILQGVQPSAPQHWIVQFNGQQYPCATTGVGAHHQFAATVALIVDQWIDEHKV